MFVGASFLSQGRMFKLFSRQQETNALCHLSGVLSLILAFNLLRKKWLLELSGDSVLYIVKLTSRLIKSSSEPFGGRPEYVFFGKDGTFVMSRGPGFMHRRVSHSSRRRFLLAFQASLSNLMALSDGSIGVGW